jgi:hypothetical protein
MRTPAAASADWRVSSILRLAFSAMASRFCFSASISTGSRF